MKTSVYSILDRKAKEFWSPKIAVNDDSIKREFAMMVNEKGNLINAFPDDFELYRIGTFDSEIGHITSYDIPNFICRGAELIGVINYEK